jgi:hypothetical protein
MRQMLLAVFIPARTDLARKERAPRFPAGLEKWNEEGFMKPKRMIEALTTPSAVPRTGGMTSA